MQGSAPRAVVHDLNADASGPGPEGEVDGVVRGGGGVGVLDTVARRLAHGEHHVVPSVSGDRERRQPAAHLDPKEGQMAGTGGPDQVNELR
jgi:hypothetical protein